MFLWLFESFLQVQLYAGANVMMLAFCSYRSACLEMPASATSVHWYLPQFCPESYIFLWLFWNLPSHAILCQCQHMDAAAHASIPAPHCYLSTCLTMPASATSIHWYLPIFASKFLFLWLFESLLVVLSHASPDVSILGPSSYQSTCLTMPANPTSIHWYLPQFHFENHVFMVVWKLPSSAIIFQWQHITTGPLWLPVCLPYNACWSNLCSLISPSVLLQKLSF